jgi:hypothetical protein
MVKHLFISERNIAGNPSQQPPFTYEDESSPVNTRTTTRSYGASRDSAAYTPETDVRLYKGKHFSRIPTKTTPITYVNPEIVSPRIARPQGGRASITKIYDASSRPPVPKVVVFDLDETIGSFADLYLLWTAIFTQGIYKGTPDTSTIQSIFNELLDLYPEFLRYGILHILDFIRTKIQNGESHRIFLYTNNQCDFVACPESRVDGQPSPTEWVEMIIVYLNWKIQASDTIFAKPVCAFKINDRIIEPLRETTSKTHRDFLKCTILPKNTEICFMDDSYHSRMVHNKVYYIQPPPYIHTLTQSDIIERFVNSDLHSKLIRTTKRNAPYTFSFPTPSMPTSPPDCARTLQRGTRGGDCAIHEMRQPEHVVDCVRTPECNRGACGGGIHKDAYDKMLYYIKEFFCITTRAIHSRRKYVRIGKFTRKNRRV